MVKILFRKKKDTDELERLYQKGSPKEISNLIGEKKVRSGSYSKFELAEAFAKKKRRR